MKLSIVFIVPLVANLLAAIIIIDQLHANATPLFRACDKHQFHEVKSRLCASLKRHPDYTDHSLPVPVKTHVVDIARKPRADLARKYFVEAILIFLSSRHFAAFLGVCCDPGCSLNYWSLYC